MTNSDTAISCRDRSLAESSVIGKQTDDDGFGRRNAVIGIVWGIFLLHVAIFALSISPLAMVWLYFRMN